MKIKLNKQVFGFWLAILTIPLFLIGPIYSGFFDANKQLTIFLQKSNNLLEKNYSPAEGSGISIIANGQELEQLYVTNILVENTGDIPINRHDYDSKIEILFPENPNIISTSVIDEYPDSLNVQHESTDTFIEVEGLLLNPQDAFTLQLVSHGEINELIVKSRISGVREIEDVHSGTERGLYVSFESENLSIHLLQVDNIWFVLLLVISNFVLGYWFELLTQSKARWAWLLVLPLFISLWITMYIAAFSPIRKEYLPLNNAFFKYTFLGTIGFSAFAGMYLTSLLKKKQPTEQDSTIAKQEKS
ncbi:hypothetical protein [Vibrio lentus]|uniref:hypothetical protein n=1 Tax=Vibrio lentus TaxID=136468 RepID=UPI000C825FEF|nr:hypothetical protein [Vibrio lentus]PMM38846.1 hypothetical protein BCT58_23550 [Vibrio lentus]